MQLKPLWASTLLFCTLTTTGQVLPVDPLEQLVPETTRQVQRSTERLQQQALQQLQQQQVAEQLAAKSGLPDPLTALPKTLEVLGQSGQPAWREVEVEQGFRAVEREWLLLLHPEQWLQFSQRWPQLADYVQSLIPLEALSQVLVTLKVPQALDASSLLQRQFAAELAELAGRNHLYQPQTQAVPAESRAAHALPMCRFPVTLGMVDTAIALDHPALAQQPERLTIVQHNFLPADIQQSFGHGTAVAGVLAAQTPDKSALLPQLTLYSASAFYASNAYQQSATLAHIVQALNYLAAKQVNVINMSLTGPDNPVLAAIVGQLTDKGIVLVAAAGNGGPGAAPLFPAAYSDVLAVTAVDQQTQLYRWANQGEYIDFAAIGVKVPTLNATGNLDRQSGTSMAAPVVSAAVACLRALTPGASLAQIKQQLIQQARDLGEPGKDNQFGYGLLEAPLKAQL